MARRFEDYEWSTCSNCEGEGRVVNWLRAGQEVPASRKRLYPNEPPENRMVNTGIRICVVCRGLGEYTYDDDGKMLTVEDFK